MKVRNRVFLKALVFFLITIPTALGIIIGLVLLIGTHPVIGFSVLVALICAVAAAVVAYS